MNAAGATTNDTGPSLRPASVVMSPVRAGAAVPNALSFSRSAMRELVRGRYRVEKIRFDLDAEGRGEVLYRLVGGGWQFHFFLVSTKLPEEQKSDRNFAQSWDAMGVLCQGEWTAQREARLRREVPKQRAGCADYDTLIYARGNRSARLFDHVVDSLAAGRQPDLKLLAPVGYILRTTAFIGNGQLGTRPLAGYETDHPFRRPYHAQFCSAFMLREYVFDLVDHIARARSRDATRLCRTYRRYLGLGNAAATGLVPFVVNHPHLMHQWCLAYEKALARAKERAATPDDGVTRRFGLLLNKAIEHFAQAVKPDDGVFITPQALSPDLDRLRDAFGEFRNAGTVDGKQAPLPWAALQAWAERNLQPEALEILNAIVIEVHPDIVNAAVDDFHADESFAVRPEMTAAQLRGLVQDDYGWALAPQFRDASSPHFWYRSSKAPRDVRRGVRGRDESLEFETSMDTVLQAQRLWACLEQTDRDTRVADVVCARPDLRHIVARVQSLAGLRYAELREQWLSDGFSPFAPVRFALSFYGMEKFEAALPKSVRGTFMQGAPIAEDVADGVDGDWPFPLMPSTPTAADANSLAPLPASRRDAAAFATPDPGEPSSLMIAPGELTRMAQTALQGHGAALGVAEDAAGLVTFLQARGEPAVAALLKHCAAGRVAREARILVSYRDESLARLDAHGASALLAAPVAFDLAYAMAQTAPRKVGAAIVDAAVDGWLVDELVLRGARRGAIVVALWQSGFAMAGPGASGILYASASSAARSSLHAALVAAGVEVAPAAECLDAFGSHAGFAIVCIRPRPTATDALFEGLVRRGVQGAFWEAGELRRRQEGWLCRGIALLRSDFDALARAGAALLVPESEEPRVLRDGADPLRVF